jgi:hypothetical protein
MVLIAVFDALTTAVDISDNWDKWFMSICISNISAILMALPRDLIEDSLDLALIVASLIILMSPEISKPSS